MFSSFFASLHLARNERAVGALRPGFEIFFHKYYLGIVEGSNPHVVLASFGFFINHLIDYINQLPLGI